MSPSCFDFTGQTFKGLKETTWLLLVTSTVFKITCSLIIYCSLSIYETAVPDWLKFTAEYRKMFVLVVVD